MKPDAASRTRSEASALIMAVVQSSQRKDLNMLRKMVCPPLVLAVAIWFTWFFYLNGVADAALSPSKTLTPGVDFHSSEDLAKVKNLLERKEVREKLIAFGMQPDEVEEKLVQMSPDQVHLLAQMSDRVAMGGGALEAIIALLVIALLVVLIIKVMDKEIIIRSK
ncbi:MAG: PA2779 family protein [Deltaproteobacteria bacterium]|nr:PA2779 family protein [Deltaproteobacteria bacterium]